MVQCSQGGDAECQQESSVWPLTASPGPAPGRGVTEAMAAGTGPPGAVQLCQQSPGSSCGSSDNQECPWVCELQSGHRGLSSGSASPTCLGSFCSDSSSSQMHFVSFTGQSFLSYEQLSQVMTPWAFVGLYCDASVVIPLLLDSSSKITDH